MDGKSASELRAEAEKYKMRVLGQQDIENMKIREVNDEQ
jgi:hypothetical protein